MGNWENTEQDLSPNRSCIACGSEIDSPEHALFECEHYQDQRTKLLHSNGVTSPQDLTKLKMSNPK